MAKFQITVEDGADGVSISVDNQNQLNSSKAGQVANVLVQNARLIARIPLEGAARHIGGCTCEVCQAMREKMIFNPTIH
ncbi:hypothetical protein [Pseudomonas saponiphila]|uniref:hypothetical protein n=1 Tax=Pseudomonas saponiphila TaxID=556534 RepID=UPI0022408599|nr:hypothetical protein [Pseudomonas saponiphila]